MPNRTINSEFDARYDQDVDLLSIFLIIWKQKFIVLAILLIGIIGTFALLKNVEPSYTAKSTILIDFDSNKSLSQKLSNSFFDVKELLTEIEILKSRRLASRIVRDLSLTEDPEFNSNFSNLDDDISGKFFALSIEEKNSSTLPSEVTDMKISSTVTNFLESLRISQVPGSMVIQVSYTSTDPYKAAFITNKIIEEYENLKTSEAINKKQKMSAWLEKTSKTLRHNLYDTDLKIENFKREKELNTNTNTNNIVTQRQAGNVLQSYNAAVERKKQLQLQVSQLSNKSNSDIITAINSSDINTNLIRDLIKEKINIEKEISNTSKRYGPKHPSMIKLKSEISNVESSIQKEISKTKKVLKQEVKLVSKQIKDFEKKIELEPDDTFEKTTAEEAIYLRNLENEAESIRLILKDFYEDYETYKDKDEILASNVHVISFASVPTYPSFPNKPLILSLSILLLLFISVLTALLLNRATVPDNTPPS